MITRQEIRCQSGWKRPEIPDYYFCQENILSTIIFVPIEELSICDTWRENFVI